MKDRWTYQHTISAVQYSATSRSSYQQQSVRLWLWYLSPQSASGLGGVPYPFGTMELVLTSRYDDAPIEYAPHNGSTGRRSFGQRQAPGMQRGVTGVVGEVEARHFWGI